MLKDLAEGLVAVLAGRQVAAGSVVLMTSLTNMAVAGTAGYAEDLLATIKYLRSNLGDHILYGPLPNILINGCSNEEAIRTCYDICKWALLHFKNSDTLLSNSFQLVEKQLTERGGRITQTNYRCVVRMPPSQSCQSRTSYLSNWDCLPAAIKPPTTAEERQAICAMMEEMRETLAVDVDPAPIVDRWPTITSVEEGVKKKLLVVGSSHAAKIGDALTKMGHEVEILFEPNWRVFRNNAATLAEKVEEKLATKSFDIIFFAVLDNSTYSALAPTGDIIPARRDNAGKYHIDGELVISSKSVLHANFTALKPLLEKAKRQRRRPDVSAAKVRQEWLLQRPGPHAGEGEPELHG
jgi:hypothetical protein